MNEVVTAEEWVEGYARARELPFRYPSLRVDGGVRFTKYLAAVTDKLPAAGEPIPDALIADAIPKLDQRSGRGGLRARAERECPTAWAAIEELIGWRDSFEPLQAGAIAAALAERQRPNPFDLQLLSTDCDCIDSPTHVLSTLIDERFVFSVEELHTETKPTAVHARRVRRLARLLYRHVPFPRNRRVSNKLEVELEHLDSHPRLAYEIARILHTCAQADEPLRRWAAHVFGSGEASGADF